MKICIIPNENKDFNKVNTKNAEKVMSELGIEYYEAPLNVTNKNFLYTDPTKFEENTDLIMVFGGDGTIIDASADLLDVNIPIVGVNLGKLGFLAEIEINNIKNYLIKILNKEYLIEERMMLDVQVNSNKYSVLNDVVIRHTSTNNMVDLELFVNKKRVAKYYGDGIIIATPTGSSAYNLSAGGPVVEPNAQLIIITPICSHNLSLRSIILNSDDNINIKINNYDKKNDKSELIIDGRTKDILKPSDEIFINKSKSVTPLIKINDNSFLEILNNKMRD